MTMHARLLSLLITGLMLFAADARAESDIVGVIVDYGPKGPGAPATQILRGGKYYPVRQQEILYPGDKFVFTPGSSDETFVKVLVNATSEISLSPKSPDLPTSFWDGFRSYLPKLVSAYRWINSGGGEKENLPRNAVSRGDGDESAAPAVLPKGPTRLEISTADGPVWVGWQSGKAPFVVTASVQGKVLAEAEVCKNPSEPCPHEATLTGIGAGADAVEIKVASANGKSWSGKLERKELAPAADAGNLTRFLRGTELLDKGRGNLVLESAREFVAIEKQYPPARALLDLIKKGEVP